MGDILRIIGFFAALCGVPFSALIGGGLWLGSMSCSAKGDAMHLPHSWGVLSECMIEAKPGRWVPLDSLKTIQTGDFQ